MELGKYISTGFCIEESGEYNFYFENATVTIDSFVNWSTSDNNDGSTRDDLDHTYSIESVKSGDTYIISYDEQQIKKIIEQCMK